MVTQVVRSMVVVSLVTLCACGGSSSDTVQVQGLWVGSLSAEPLYIEFPLVAAIQQDGETLVADAAGDVYVLPSFTGTAGSDGFEHVTGTATTYAADFATLPDGALQHTFKYSARASDVFITASLDDFLPLSPPVQAGIDLAPYKPLQFAPSLMSGNWTGDIVGVGGAVSLQMDSSGAFTGTITTPGQTCTVSGQMGQPDPNHDLFSVSLDSVGAKADCYGQTTGLAFESDAGLQGFGNHLSGVTGPFYYLIVHSTLGAYLLQVTVK